MKWKHWSILIVLVLLNYLIFSSAFTELVRRQRGGVPPTRTPQATFEVVEAAPVAWKILPTNTPYGTLAPIATPTETLSTTQVITAQIVAALLTTSTVAAPTATPVPQTIMPSDTPDPTPTGQVIVHVVKRGEHLGIISRLYNVTVESIIKANSLDNPSLIYAGERLNIPVAGQAIPTTTPQPAQTGSPTDTPAPTATPKPTSAPSATDKPTSVPTATVKPTSVSQQFTAELEWRPSVAPNCAGPGISSLSVIKDAAGKPVNGVVVEVNCYGNRWPTIPSGKQGVYAAGHYDWSPGQTQPVDWVCTARVIEINGQAVTSSEEVSIQFDTKDCRPNKSGHQVAILNWTKW
jgi:LysM repeat protein